MTKVNSSKTRDGPPEERLLLWGLPIDRSFGDEDDDVDDRRSDAGRRFEGRRSYNDGRHSDSHQLDSRHSDSRYLDSGHSDRHQLDSRHSDNRRRFPIHGVKRESSSRDRRIRKEVPQMDEDDR